MQEPVSWEQFPIWVGQARQGQDGWFKSSKHRLPLNVWILMTRQGISPLGLEQGDSVGGWIGLEEVGRGGIIPASNLFAVLITRSILEFIFHPNSPHRFSFPIRNLSYRTSYIQAMTDGYLVDSGTILCFGMLIILSV